MLFPSYLASLMYCNLTHLRLIIRDGLLSWPQMYRVVICVASCITALIRTSLGDGDACFAEELISEVEARAGSLFAQLDSPSMKDSTTPPPDEPPFQLQQLIDAPRNPFRTRWLLTQVEDTKGAPGLDTLFRDDDDGADLFD